MPERLFSANQIANLLGVTPGTVGQWIKQGWLPHKRLPQGSLRISEKHLVRFLKDRGVDIEKVMAKAVMREKNASSVSADELVIEADTNQKISLAGGSSDEPKQLEAVTVGAHKTQANQQAGDDQTPDISASREASDDEKAGPRPSWVSVAQMRAKAELEGKPFDLESIEAEIASMTSKTSIKKDTPAQVADDEDQEMDLEELAGAILAEDDEGGEYEEAIAPADADEIELESASVQAVEAVVDPEPVSPEPQAPEIAQEPEATETGEPEIAQEVEVSGELEKEIQPEAEHIEEIAEETKEIEEVKEPEVVKENSLVPEKHPEPVSHPVSEPVRHKVADRIDQIGDSVLADAIDTSASAIHLQAGKDGGSLTMRVGGVLVQRNNWPELSSNGQAEKLIAYFIQEAKINGSGTGSLVAEHQGRQIDLALTLLPAIGGKRLTIRLIDPARQMPTFADLGLSAEDAASVRSVLAGQAGLTLVAGPDARATAQLLMATAGEFRSPGSDVIYLARKAETGIDGLTVCSIDPKAGFDFAQAVGSAVASDPDALCVGELCDPATAVSSFEAAQCGTPVVAGLTGASVAEVIALLSEMGIEGWPLSMILKGIILCARVKELCPACKTAGADGYSPAGCNQCGHSGYSGQKMLVSVAKTSLPIERALRNGASGDEIQQAAIASGMKTLTQVAGEMFNAGLISTGELQRTVGQ